MSKITRPTRRRGISTNAVIALVVGLLAVVAIGLAVGRRALNPTSNGGTTDSPAVDPVAQPTASKPDATARPQGSSTIVPPVVFDPETVDIGMLKPGETGESTFTMRNTGEAPLTLVAMRPDCRCTTLQDLSGTVIAPGEAIDVTTQLDGGSIVGNRNSRIKFVFKGYDEPAVVPIVAVVSRAVQVAPSYLSALDQDHGQLFVGSLDDRPFRVLAVNGGPPDYVEYDPASGEVLTRYALHWDVRPYDPITCVDAQGNRMPGWYVIETDHPEAPVVEIIVRHRCNRVLPPGSRTWVPTDRHVNLGALRPGESTEASVTVKWLPRRPTVEMVQAASSESDQFDVELLETVRKGDELECRLRFTASTSHLGLVYGQMSLHSVANNAPVTVIGTIRP